MNSNCSCHPGTLKSSQIVDFSVPVTLKFDGWPKKTIGHPFYATESFVHHFVPIRKFKLELKSGNTQIGAKFVLTYVTLTFSMDITSVNGNYSWKFHVTMTNIVKKFSQTDGRTEVFLVAAKNTHVKEIEAQCTNITCIGPDGNKTPTS